MHTFVASTSFILLACPTNWTLVDTGSGTDCFHVLSRQGGFQSVQDARTACMDELGADLASFPDENTQNSVLEDQESKVSARVPGRR